MNERLLDEAKRAEGSVVTAGRHHVYKDSLGLDTVGYGRLVSRGFSQDEAELMLENDISDAVADSHAYQWFADLDEVRQDVVSMMIMNMGAARFAGFKLMILALSNHNYDEAANQMESSLWAQQVKGRATRYATIMRSGVWQ